MIDHAREARMEDAAQLAILAGMSYIYSRAPNFRASASEVAMPS